MKKLFSLLSLVLATSAVSAETITATYYGSEIDLTQKNNPCKGNTDGGVTVMVITNVTSVENAPERTVVERIYKLPDGEVLKRSREVIDSPKATVLHKLFPHEYPNK